MGRGQNAAMAERARTELARAIHPTDDAAGGEKIDRPLHERRVVELFDELIVFASGARQLS